MKFKKDGTGWRDLQHRAEDDELLNVSIPDRGLDGNPFVSCTWGDNYASASLSRRKLRAFAKAILKELDR